MTLEDRIREVVSEAVRKSVRETLDGLEVPSSDGEPADGWRSRLWQVAPETRLALADVAEALDISTRTVRRHLNGETKAPRLPHQRGPAGLTVRAGDLRDWVEDVEGANRWREGAA